MKRPASSRLGTGALVLATTLLWPVHLAHAAVQCDGRSATIVGTPGDDTLTATAGEDVIAGLGGNDTINGLRGFDVVCGGPGHDTISVVAGGKALGEDGNDRLVNAATSSDTNNFFADLIGGPGGDTLLGGPSSQFFEPGPGDDVVDGRGGQPPGGESVSILAYSDAAGPVQVYLLAGYAEGEGRDTITDIRDVWGSAYADVLVGTNQANTLYGGFNRFPSANDEIIAGAGGADFLSAVDDLGVLNHRLLGGPGDDILDATQLSGDDVLSGGTGTDLVRYGDPEVPLPSPGPGIRVNLVAGTADGEFYGSDRIDQVENVVGTSQADFLLGDDGPNVLRGYQGNDTIAGNGGDDFLYGDDRRDRLDGGPGNDFCDSTLFAMSCEST